jgi:hypothetical protein
MPPGWSVLTYGALDCIIAFAPAGSFNQFFAITKSHELFPVSKKLIVRKIEDSASVFNICGEFITRYQGNAKLLTNKVVKAYFA